jgi:cytochrome c oxidase subunit 2
MDTVPGMQTYVWFNSDTPAEYDILCAEYCGVRHAYMLSKVIVMPETEYEQWVSAEKATTEKHEGLVLLENNGCLDCHSLDGTELVGPTLKDIYDRETVIVDDKGNEKTIKADEQYLKKAIYDPSAEIVKDYEDMMPPYNEDISEEELGKIIDYLKGGMPEEKFGEKGAVIAENEGCLGCHSTDGSIIVGPSFKNMLGRELVAVKDGEKQELTANTQYIINAIQSPGDYVVEGFDNSMPPYDYLGDDEIKALLEYFSTLKD